MKKKKFLSISALFNLRSVIALALLVCGCAITFFAAGVFPGSGAQIAGPQQDRPGTQKPDIVMAVGPVSQDMDLNALPYIPPSPREEEFRLTPHNWDHHPISHSFTENLLDYRQILKPDIPTPLIPASSVSFAGVNSGTSGCGCLPPDTDGDVGPNDYVQSVNSGIKIFNKTTGAQLLAFTTYNSFFASLTGTPCNGSNDGDGLAIYDSKADRWVVTDFAFPAFPGTSFYQCIGVSKTNDPVAGGWYLYALQVDPTNTAALGDYPKMAAWSDGYYLTMNEFTNNTTFVGVRVYALNRTSMLSGGATNAVGFTISAATLGNAYSLLPATYRFGAPPAGAAEYILAVDSTDNATLNTAVYAWRFHADFVTPSMSTLGLTANHNPNATITVAGFYDALEGTGASATTLEIPQPTTANREDTLGDKLMYPLYYQNLNGVESLWADQTVNTGSNATAFTNPTGIRWYQFIVTGGVLPAGAAQTQTFTNGNDGLWRFMPSLALDYQGDLAINYTAGNGSTNTGVRYAGRLAGDAANSLAQGEATLIAGGGHQTSSSGRWGDYSATGVDVSDSCSFYMTNEYYTANSSSSWATRVGAFKFATCLTPPTLVSVVSRFTHGNGAGTFNLTLSTSSRVVEPRTDFTGNYTIVFNFNVPVNSGSATTTGSVGSNSTSFSGNSMIVSLTGVSDMQNVTVTANNVSGPGTGTLASVSTEIGFLIGDVSQDGTVNVGDTVQVRNNAGVTLNNTNFQNDVNTDGAVNAGDTQMVRSRSGNGLPPP